VRAKRSSGTVRRSIRPQGGKPSAPQRSTSPPSRSSDRKSETLSTASVTYGSRTEHFAFPLFPDERTFTRSVGRSERCQTRTFISDWLSRLPDACNLHTVCPAFVRFARRLGLSLGGYNEAARSHRDAWRRDGRVAAYGPHPAVRNAGGRVLFTPGEGLRSARRPLSIWQSCVNAASPRRRQPYTVHASWDRRQFALQNARKDRPSVQTGRGLAR